MTHKGHNTQSGRDLIEGRIEGLSMIRVDSYEQNYQEAMRYRRKLSAGTLHLAECTKEQLLYHFDMLARSASAWRGMKIVNGSKGG
jgi:hypothetical protein